MKHWIDQINNITEAILDHFGTLSEAELNWKPNPETWSIAQNIDHLIVINQTYFPILDELRAGKYKLPFTAKFGFLITYFGNLILKASSPDRKKKMKTFPIWTPSVSDISSGILEQFVKHQEVLKREMEASKKLIENGAVIGSPANKNIVYKLERAFDIIVAHEQRHLEQSKEVLRAMKAPKTKN